MEDPSPLRRIYLGRVQLQPPIEALRRSLDRSLQEVCAALPAPLHDPAREFLTSRGQPTVEQSFFAHYYSPLWSWIHWAAAAADHEEVVAGQAMAMFLHLLDDHLCDGQLPCSPLLLQLRTAAWLRLEQSARALSDPVDAELALWRDDLTRYFAAQQRRPAATELDGYCARFRDEMATCVTIPALTLRRQGHTAAAADLRQILFGLGVAWRLIDDVQDAYADWRAGHRSILYILLHEQPGTGQEGVPSNSDSAEQWARVVEMLFRCGVLRRVLDRCSAELLSAAQLAAERSWSGLADELTQLRQPVAELSGRLP